MGLVSLFHSLPGSAGFPACCIAGFLTCGRLNQWSGLPTGKSAVRQARKPALRALMRRSSSCSEISGARPNQLTWPELDAFR